MTKLKIGLISVSELEFLYKEVRQINTYLPVEIVPMNIGSAVKDDLFFLVNNLENSIKK